MAKKAQATAATVGVQRATNAARRRTASRPTPVPVASFLPQGPARVLPRGVERAASGWLKPPEPSYTPIVPTPPDYQPLDTQNGGRALRDHGIDIDPNVTAADWDRFHGAGRRGSPPAVSPFDPGGGTSESPDAGREYGAPVNAADWAAALHSERDGTEYVGNIDEAVNDAPLLGDGADPGIAVRPVTLVDIDNLWDWVRSDEDHGRAFLGRVMPTSLDLHAFFRDLQDREATGATATFAVDQHGVHVGFVVFDPISLQMATACLHLYLAPEVRGSLAVLLPALLGLADERFPALTLLVATTSAAAARLYRPFGFETTFVLRRVAQGDRHGRRSGYDGVDGVDSGVVGPRGPDGA